MKTIRVGLAIALIGLPAVAGCGDADVGEAGEDEVVDVGDEDIGGEDLEVGESSEAIKKDAWNGSCAQSLSLRVSPNGGYACGYWMTYGTALYVNSISGNWAHVYVGSGLCGGMSGWVMKDYVSRNCLL